MNPSSFEHIVRIQFNALMMTVIKCTVKNRNRQFARRSKREVLFCELSDTKNVECVTKDNYSCDYEDVKVVILGQDPYHELHQANGLAFSVYPGVKIPPSLVNIYKELKDDVNTFIPNHGDLTKWAKQGVLLLNNVLTVEEGKANSHAGIGWEIFTLNIVKALNRREKPMVFILWGNNARSKKQYIDTSRHLVLESAHPSPLSAHRGFFGSKPFSKANDFLIKNNMTPIDWQIENV